MRGDLRRGTTNHHRRHQDALQRQWWHPPNHACVRQTCYRHGLAVVSDSIVTFGEGVDLHIIDVVVEFPNILLLAPSGTNVHGEWTAGWHLTCVGAGVGAIDAWVDAGWSPWTIRPGVHYWWIGAKDHRALGVTRILYIVLVMSVHCLGKMCSWR